MEECGHSEQRAVVVLDGPFFDGDVLTIPFDFLNVPTAVSERDRYPNGYMYYVVLDRLGLWGRRYRLRGVRGEARTLHLSLPRMVVVERADKEGRHGARPDDHGGGEQ